MYQLDLYGKRTIVPIKKDVIFHGCFTGDNSYIWWRACYHPDGTINVNMGKLLILSDSDENYFSRLFSHSVSHEIIHKILHRWFGYAVSQQFDNTRFVRGESG